MIDKAYIHAFEEKWRLAWETSGIYRTDMRSTKPKRYILEMFPYPSGQLHMGHVRNYALGDVLARFYRMRGDSVLYPIGFDALGLPAENAAKQNQTHPRTWTDANIHTMCGQLTRLGLSYDWNRLIKTCDPEYYRWTQWLFIQLYKKGLVYKKQAPVNWCTTCETVLANEQVVDGVCWRCQTPVETKTLAQWFIRITAYADDLLDGLDTLTAWPDHVKQMQSNWIGRSAGLLIRFETDAQPITVYTTRPDTLEGVTYLAVARTHPCLDALPISRSIRAQLNTENTGFTGCYARHPISQDPVPIWVADYVLGDYGTGAVMGVPAHDDRDYAFACQHKLPIIPVIGPFQDDPVLPYTEAGIMIAGAYKGEPSTQVKAKISAQIIALNAGQAQVTYRLRDWLISRQRYWGTPIPIVYCPDCGVVPDDRLPVTLPDAVDFTAPGNPLDTADFKHTTCPTCQQPAVRETDTMDTFIDSSWYFFRYLDPTHTQAINADLDTYMPVDQYIGGVEHAILHLLYARFITRACYDLGLTSVKEPFKALLTQGMVIKDGFKMSKSRGNTVDPTALINQYGADTVRIFILFAAPVNRDLIWSDAGIMGAHRFLARVYRLITEPRLPSDDLSTCLNKAIISVTQDIERMHYNTAISTLMTLVNTLTKQGITPEASGIVLRLLAPFAPFLAEELWSYLGHTQSVHTQPWPSATVLQDAAITIIFQVNGKVRDKAVMTPGLSREALIAAAEASPAIQRYTQTNAVKKTIVVADKLVNFVL